MRKPLNSVRLAISRAYRYSLRMKTTLKISRIGNSAGVILSKEALDHLGAAIGDQLTVTRTSRGLELSKICDDQPDDFEHQMAIAREVMERDRNILAALAKS